MAIQTKATGTYITTTTTVHEGRGRILAYMVSHGQDTPQTVTFYDNTAASGTVAHQVIVAPERSPVYIQFARRPDESKLLGISFETGLTVDPGNCEVAVWAIGY